MKIIFWQDKRIINTQFGFRTIAERKRILQVIFKLKCFEHFSPLTRSELAKVVFFSYYQKGRTIVRENHIPSICYFILDGEISVYKKKWDNVIILLAVWDMGYKL